VRQQHPLPSGTRDVLPDEMRELRAVKSALRDVFEARGYGEVYTPALEREMGVRGAAPPGYRLFDEHGETLVLRSDMTVPIARVAATRYADVGPPLRFSYIAHAYRAVRPHLGQAREMLQAGIELLGASGAQGTAEALEVLCEALEAAGLRGYRIGLGDASLFGSLLERAGVPPEARTAAQHELLTRDFVGVARELRVLGAEPLLEIVGRRGGPEVLEGVAEGLREVHEALRPETAERVIFDLGLTRDLGYYTGPVFEVYDAALGQPIGGGGRYDDLVGRLGRDLPAVGWGLNVERLHRALVDEARAKHGAGENAHGPGRWGR
jgi:ATP phosphoribosyltransferase regulatory subunit